MNMNTFLLGLVAVLIGTAIWVLIKMIFDKESKEEASKPIIKTNKKKVFYFLKKTASFIFGICYFLSVIIINSFIKVDPLIGLAIGGGGIILFFGAYLLYDYLKPHIRKLFFGEEREEQLDKTENTSIDINSTPPKYAFSDELILKDENGNPVQAQINSEKIDGKYEVYTEAPINGWRVKLLTEDEIDAMLLEHNE